jgi:hypothetical protein
VIVMNLSLRQPNIRPQETVEGSRDTTTWQVSYGVISGTAKKKFSDHVKLSTSVTELLSSVVSLFKTRVTSRVSAIQASASI